MSGWDNLKRELDAWGVDNQCATFWWRDDDATRPCPALERLLSISAALRVPLALSAVPMRIVDALQARVDTESLVAVLQHGWSHDNHAGSGDTNAELGPHRPREVILVELVRGRDRISEFQFGLPVLVPPWNQIDPGLFPSLPGIGISGVSMTSPRSRGQPTHGLRCVNVHVDPMEWRNPVRFLGVEPTLAQVVQHLRHRRLGGADPDEPTGILTHHLNHDDACWPFLEDLLSLVSEHPAARWLHAREVFWP